MSPSSRKIPALLTKNSVQPCQTESYGEIMWIRVRPTDDDDEDGSAVRSLRIDPIVNSLNRPSAKLSLRMRRVARLLNFKA